jgi:hypothetical protein
MERTIRGLGFILKAVPPACFARMVPLARAATPAAAPALPLRIAGPAAVRGAVC